MGRRRHPQSLHQLQSRRPIGTACWRERGSGSSDLFGQPSGLCGCQHSHCNCYHIRHLIWKVLDRVPQSTAVHLEQNSYWMLPMTEVALWAAGATAFCAFIIFGSKIGWGTNPSRSRILICIFTGALAVVISLMILGAVGMPDRALTASIPALIIVAGAVGVQARKRHPSAFHRSAAGDPRH